MSLITTYIDSIETIHLLDERRLLDLYMPCTLYSNLWLILNLIVESCVTKHGFMNAENENSIKADVVMWILFDDQDSQAKP